MSIVTLDENYKGSGVTLSEDKLSCTYTKTNFVRATKGVSFGKWYWEVKLTGSGDIRSFAGIVSEDATDKDATSCLCGPIGEFLYLQSGYCYSIAVCPKFLMYKESHLITNASYGLEYYTPDTWIGIALDLDNKTIRCTYKGNDLGLMWDGLESATYYPAFSLDGGRYDGDKNGVHHVNFGAAPFKYPIPEGYTSYDGNQGSINRYLLKDDEGYKGYIRENGVPITYADRTLIGVSSKTSVSKGFKSPDFNGVSSGKWYWEQDLMYQATSLTGIVCLGNLNNFISSYGSQIYAAKDIILDDRIGTSDRFNYLYDCNLKVTDTVGLALDLDNGTIEFYRTGLTSGFVTGGKVKFKVESMLPIIPTVASYSSGTQCGATANFGATPFKFPIPEGFLPLNHSRNVVSTELVSTEIPTENQFKEKGMSEIPSYGQLSNFNDLVTYTIGNLSKSLVKFKPKAKTVLSSGAINFSGKELKKVSLIGTDNARVLFSKDRGVTWYNKTSNKISIVSASSTSHCYAEVRSPSKVLDGIKNDTSFWYVYNTAYQPNETGHVLTLELSNPRQVTDIDIYGRCPSGRGGGVKDFEIYGSNDGVERVLLFSATGPSVGDAIVYKINCVLANNEKFKYYLFNFKGSYYNATTVGVSEIELFGIPSPTHISDISTQGLTPTQLTSMTPEEWKSFMGDSRTLRFAYYLPDETANTDKLELTVDFIGE